MFLYLVWELEKYLWVNFDRCSISWCLTGAKFAEAKTGILEQLFLLHHQARWKLKKSDICTRIWSKRSEKNRKQMRKKNVFFGTKWFLVTYLCWKTWYHVKCARCLIKCEWSAKRRSAFFIFQIFSAFPQSLPQLEIS